MSEEEARSALQEICTKLQAANVPIPKDQVDSWLQQIRMMGKGYFMGPEAVEFINQLNIEYNL